MKNTTTNNEIKTVVAAHSLEGQVIPLEFRVSANETDKLLGNSTLVKCNVIIDRHDLIIPALSGTSLTVRLQAKFRAKGTLPEQIKLSELVSNESSRPKKAEMPKSHSDFIKVYRSMFNKSNKDIEKCKILTKTLLDLTDLEAETIWEAVKEYCPQT